jgi:hypothetical protein
MSDKFTGNWLVTEYVHHPDGAFLGIVRQKRRLVKLENTIRVIQDCEISPELANHPMKDFAGHWEFDIERKERFRFYQGPDVLGLGVSWGENYIEGSGKWPRFGYDFKSFSLLVSPERQLTGGTFSKEHEPMAVIIGVARPEKEDALEAWPNLNLEAKSPKHKRGKIETFNMRGEPISPLQFPDLAINSRHYSCYSEGIVIEDNHIMIDEKRIIDSDNCYVIRQYSAHRAPVGYELSFFTE